MKHLIDIIRESDNPLEPPIGLISTPRQQLQVTKDKDLNPNCKWIFTVIKPGFLNIAQQVIDEFLEDGWQIYKTTTKTLTLPEAHTLYETHKKEDFYEDLCKYMSSGPSMAIIYTRPGVIRKNMFDRVGQLKDKIRQEYGESDMRNVLHSSDNYSDMLRESSVYF